MNIELPPSPPPDCFEARLPIEEGTLANKLIAWHAQARLPLEKETLDELIPKLQAFMADPTAILDYRARLAFVRFRLALNDVAAQWSELNAGQRWDIYRERLVMRRVAGVMNAPNAMMGSLRTLKQQIDDDIREVMLLITALPTIALAVAILGVANLMMVNVAARSRQIAVVRAVGATRSQIVRLVLAEALTLGLLGSLVGVVLGFHSAYSMNVVVNGILGIELGVPVPLSQVSGAVALTLLFCLLAGLAPARRAASSNVVSAMASA